MKILVIRFLEIGDVLLSSTLCSTLKASFPEAQVDYLMYDTSASLFDGHSAVDNVIVINKKQRRNPIKFLTKAISIAGQNYDLIIDATSTNKSEFISLFARKTHIKIGRKKKGRGFSYTHVVPKSQLKGSKIEQRLALLSPLTDLGYSLKFVKKMELQIYAAERYTLRERAFKKGVDVSKKIIAFSVSAKFDQKKWCRSYMEETIQHCLDKYDAQIIFVAGLPHEQRDASIVYESMGKPSNVFSNIEVTSLRELATLISFCDVFIGNEGGPRHIAEALGVPTASVFAPCSRLDEWMPYRCKKHQGIEWQSINHSDSLPIEFEEIGDSKYYQLYNSIKPAHFIPIVDSVMSQTTVKRLTNNIVKSVA